jgi:hypothetical protein
VKAFIIKVIMLGKKNFKHQQHYRSLKETGVSRRALNLILEDLDSKGYLLDSAIGEVQILDVSSIMLDSEEKLLLEHRELRAKVNIFENFASFEEEIVVLNKRIEVLLKRLRC